jgi:predicted phosphodiesterase
MKIQVLSDLHLEFQPYTLKLQKDADVLVLAGDICPPKLVGRMKHILGRLNKDIPVIYITGNHEYYGSQFDAVNDFWEDFAKNTPNFHFLNNKTLVLGGYQFVGSTLWTNFDLVRSSGLPLDIFKTRVPFAINDFMAIRHGDGLFTPDHCIDLNVAARKFIKESVDGYDGKSVVVTHFCPHPKSIHENFMDSKLNCYFTCDCSEIFQPKIPLWLHGHTHEVMDYMLGDTHVVCNPRGYPTEKSDYNSKLLVELP